MLAILKRFKTDESKEPKWILKVEASRNKKITNSFVQHSTFF